jgi:hypothetical protein
MTVGPHKGLYTTRAKAEFLTRLHGDLNTHAKPGGRIAAFYDVPALYLQTTLRPALPTVWPFWYFPQQQLLDYLNDHAAAGGLAIRMGDFPGRVHPVAPQNTALDGRVQVAQRLLVARPEYNLYALPSAAPPK